MTPTLTPAQVAEQLQRDPQLLHNTREQAFSVGLLAQIMARADVHYALSRAMDAVRESVDLPTAVALIGRVYLHAAKVYEQRPSRQQLPGPSKAEELHQRAEFLLHVSQLLAALPQLI